MKEEGKNWKHTKTEEREDGEDALAPLATRREHSPPTLRTIAQFRESLNSIRTVYSEVKVQNLKLGDGCEGSPESEVSGGRVIKSLVIASCILPQQ